MNIIGSIFFVVSEWISYSSGASITIPTGTGGGTITIPIADNVNQWVFYILGIFWIGSIIGLQCLSQVIVADLMPSSLHKKSIKLARCYGAYCMFFGIGMLFNVCITQAFLKSSNPDRRKYAFR